MIDEMRESQGPDDRRPYRLQQDFGFYSLYACIRVQSVQLCVILWAITHQAPLSLKISKQEYWSGQPFPSPEDLPNPGMEPGSPVLQADSLLSEPPGKPVLSIMGSNWKFLSWSMKATVRHVCFEVQIGICSDLLEPILFWLSNIFNYIPAFKIQDLLLDWSWRVRESEAFGLILRSWVNEGAIY